MAAIFDFRETPDPGKEREKKALHPRIVPKGVIHTETLIKEIAYGSSLTEGDMKAAISLLANRIGYYLKEGFHVELEGIGKFSASLKAKPVTDKNEIRAASVHFNHVTFRPAKRLQDDVRSGELIRASSHRGFHHSKEISQEECKLRLIEFLKKNPCITRAEYSAITGKLKSKALQDLNEWIKKGYLRKHGKYTNSIYIPDENYGTFTE